MVTTAEDAHDPGFAFIGFILFMPIGLFTPSLALGFIVGLVDLYGGLCFISGSLLRSFEIVRLHGVSAPRSPRSIRPR